jgi:hypothetical protein
MSVCGCKVKVLVRGRVKNDINKREKSLYSANEPFMKELNYCNLFCIKHVIKQCTYYLRDETSFKSHAKEQLQNIQYKHLVYISAYRNIHMPYMSHWLSPEVYNQLFFAPASALRQLWR